jgi:hypothetical protein
MYKMKKGRKRLAPTYQRLTAAEFHSFSILRWYPLSVGLAAVAVAAAVAAELAWLRPQRK